MTRALAAPGTAPCRDKDISGLVLPAAGLAAPPHCCSLRSLPAPSAQPGSAPPARPRQRPFASAGLGCRRSGAGSAVPGDGGTAIPSPSRGCSAEGWPGAEGGGDVGPGFSQPGREGSQELSAASLVLP